MNTATIGVDSQCLSYLIDVIHDINEPSDNLASEKIALFRLYLYLPGTLFVTQTVVDECAKIRDEARKELHDNYIGVLFGEVLRQNTDSIDLRTKVLEQDHSGKNDCCILAEAEGAEFVSLLSYDDNFLKHLQGVSPNVNLCRPTEYWAQLNISKGTKPDKIPHATNPLAEQVWWKW